MSETDLIASDIHAYLSRHERKDLLRFIEATGHEPLVLKVTA